MRSNQIVRYIHTKSLDGIANLKQILSRVFKLNGFKILNLKTIANLCGSLLFVSFGLPLQTNTT